MKKIVYSVIAVAFVLGAFASKTNAAFTTNLTVGSTGSDVVALQTWLVSKNFLKMPAGVSMGYFGQLTKSAVAAYQATVSLPTTGFFGPMTRAKLDSVGGSMTTGGTMTTPVAVGCPAGFTCTPAAGSTSTTVSTTGVEGTIVVEKETSGVKTTVYEGDSQVSVLGVRVEAKDSDAKIGRIKVGLGTTTDTYVKVFKKLYVTDANGTVLTSKDLNSSTVSRDSSVSPAQYYVQLSDVNYVVPAGTKKSLYVKADISSSISSEYRRSWTVALYGSNDAVRSTDGAGIDQYAGGSTNTGTNGSVNGGTYQAVVVSSSLSDNATLTVSTDAGLRKASTVVADQGASNNEKDAEVLGSFRLLAEKDDVLIRDITVTAATTTAGDATLQTAYLFDGSSQIGSASVSVNSSGAYVAAFTSIDYKIAKDSSKVLTVKYDIRGAGTTAEVVALSSVAVGSAESVGTGRTLTVTTLSSGVGESMTVVSKGAVTSLVSNDLQITKTTDQNGSTTEAHLTATFNVKIASVGSDVAFGTPGTAFQVTLLKNGVAYTALRSATSATTTYYPSTQPTGVTGYSASGFTVPRNTEVTIPVTYKLDTTTGTSLDLASGNYSVRLSTINFGVAPATTGISADYSSNAAWVTAEKAR